MKATKVNHIEILNNLKAELSVLTRETEEAENKWFNTRDINGRTDTKLFDVYFALDNKKNKLERERKFHEIMLQEKKYATEWLWSDAHAYEIIEEKTDKMILVRRMKATIKPEAKDALHESFVPGGFCGHFNNDLQEWDFEVDEKQPIEIIRKHKNGLWYANGKRHFTIEAKPYEHYDFNF